MSIVIQTIAAIRETEKYAEKSKLLHLLLGAISNKKYRLSPEEKTEFSAFIFKEIEHLLLLIPSLQSYKEKDFLFEYWYHLQDAVMTCYRTAEELSEIDRVVL